MLLLFMLSSSGGFAFFEGLDSSGASKNLFPGTPYHNLIVTVIAFVTTPLSTLTGTLTRVPYLATRPSSCIDGTIWGETLLSRHIPAALQNVQVALTISWIGCESPTRQNFACPSLFSSPSPYRAEAVSHWLPRLTRRPLPPAVVMRLLKTIMHQRCLSPGRGGGVCK